MGRAPHGNILDTSQEDSIYDLITKSWVLTQCAELQSSPCATTLFTLHVFKASANGGTAKRVPPTLVLIYEQNMVEHA